MYSIKHGLCILAFLISSISATTINVPTDLPTIQLAINASNNGDTVLVAAGTYYENINFNGKKIILASYFIITGDESYIDQTILNGDQNESVVTISNGETNPTTIIGFTITNGKAIASNTGGGITIGNSSAPRLENLVIDGNTVNVSSTRTSGAGIYIYQSSAILEDVVVSNNSITTSSTYALYGAGIYSERSDLTLTNVTVSNNVLTTEASAKGSGIMASGWSPTFGSLTITNSYITGNSINARFAFGGGIYSDGPVVALSNAIIDNNTAISYEGGSRGGGIYLSMNILNADSILVSNNYCRGGNMLPAYSNGGGLYLAGNVTLTNSKVINNTADQSYAPGIAEIFGGGICFISSECNLTLQSTEIRDNSAIGNVSIGDRRAFGGGVYIESSSNNTITDVILSGNRGEDAGGGIYYSNSGGTLTTSILNSNISDEGGSIYFYNSNPTISTSTILNSGYQWILGIHGAAIHCNSSSPTIANCTIANNSSQSDVQGILTENGSWPNIHNSNICYNGVGVYNNDNSQMLAIPNNWWGDSSGPYQQYSNPTGSGDTVNVFVNPIPFFTAPDVSAPPIPVQNLQITNSGLNFVDLNWGPSPIGDLAGYNVYYDTDITGFPYANTVDVGTDTSYTLSGLPSGITFYLAVSCYDTDGNESWYSEEVSAVTRILEVQNLDIGGDENLQHLVTHTPTISFGYYDSMGEPQTTYHTQVSTQSDFSSIDVWDTGDVASDATSVTYAGNPLVDGQTYYLRVKVASGDFWSDWATLEFRMNSEPSAPVAIAPINDAVVSLLVILKVLNSADAEGDTLTYSFKIYGDISRSTLLDSAIAVLEGQDTTSWQVVAELPDNGQYWWTASANDGYEEGGVSDTVSFLLNAVNDAPEVFALLSPQDSAEVATLTPLLDWEVAFDPDPVDTVRYSLHLDTPDPGVEVISVDTATSFQIASPLSDNTTYYWKVVARDLSGATTENTGGFHSYRVNTANDPPSDFALTSPENGSMVTDLTPAFHWEEATDPDGESAAVSYRFYLEGDTSFTGVTPVELVTNSYTLASDLTEDEVYYWKVVAVDDLGGETSSVTWSFWTNNANSPPAEFTLVSPVDGSGIATLSPAFSWHPSSDGDIGDSLVYSLELGASVDSLAVVYTGTDTVYTPSDSLTDNTTYYWKVVARDLSGATTENTGGYHRFRTNTANDPPSEFALLSPSDGTMVTDLTPIFLWQESIDPDNGQSGMLYRFYLGSDSLLTGVTPMEIETNSYTPAEDLTEDQVCYWKVVAVDTSGGETASAVWWFWTNNVNSPPEEFALVIPVDNGELTTLTPTFTWQASEDADIADSLQYSLELGESVDSLKVVYSGIDTTYTAGAPLTDNTMYHWKVVARDLSGATMENTGGYHCFRVNMGNDLPGEFALISPEDGSMATDLTPAFHWEESIDPDDPLGVEYLFYIGADTLYTGVTPVGLDSVRYILPSPLQEDQVYYWKVVAIDTSGGEMPSSIWWFWTNNVNSPPEEFDLVAPADDIELTTLTPTFTWRASEDADIADSLQYGLELGENVDSLKVVYSGTDTTYTAGTPLTDNTTYYWKVVARDLAGATTENTGGYHRFSTNVANEPPLPIFLVTPTDSSIEVDLMPQFYWTEGEDPDPNDEVTYSFYCWLSGTSPSDSLVTDTNSVEIAMSLDDNSEYLWSVKCYDLHGAVSESETLLFWTDAFPEAPLPFMTLSPSADSIGLPTEVEFVWNSTSDPDPVDQISYTLVYTTNWEDSSTYEWIDGIADTSIIIPLEDHTTYYWMVEAIDEDSLTTLSNDGEPVRFAVGQPLSLVEWDVIPEEFALHQNYPNPFNPSSTIRYDIPEGTYVQMIVFDIVGREIVRLIDRRMEPGYHQIIWNGRDRVGREVPTGIYITRILTPQYTKSIKMMLLK